MIKVNFTPAIPFSKTYLDDLYNVGKRYSWKSVVSNQCAVMSRYEMRKAAGMMLKEDRKVVDLFNKPKFHQFKELLGDWLISGDAWDERDLLDLLAKCVVECYDESIQDVLTGKDKELAGYLADEQRGASYA